MPARREARARGPWGLPLREKRLRADRRARDDPETPLTTPSGSICATITSARTVLVRSAASPRPKARSTASSRLILLLGRFASLILSPPPGAATPSLMRPWSKPSLTASLRRGACGGQAKTPGTCKMPPLGRSQDRKRKRGAPMQGICMPGRGAAQLRGESAPRAQSQRYAPCLPPRMASAGEEPTVRRPAPRQQHRQARDERSRQERDRGNHAVTGLGET